jgi:hypothetical protein
MRLDSLPVAPRPGDDGLLAIRSGKAEPGSSDPSPTPGIRLRRVRDEATTIGAGRILTPL